MVKLSDRLVSIADEIKKGQTMADIGCDHGFLPFYLLKEGISPKVIMIDISEKSLEKAKMTFQGLEDFAETFSNFQGGNFTPEIQPQWDFRVGDGLCPLDDEEVDSVVIAGVGGYLITEILERNIEKARKLDSIILQPRDSTGYMRKWLNENHFEILRHKLVREGKFVCQIIVAKYNPNISKLDECYFPEVFKLQDFDKNVDKGILVSSKELVKEMLNIYLRQTKNVLKGLNMAQNPDREAINQKQKEIDRINYLLKE